ncbi:MAG: hypothetical protein H6510_17010 [Acidobacteria bacterium]|nr:hypothetical protein [Acidobacteriota bacterium]
MSNIDKCIEGLQQYEWFSCVGTGFPNTSEFQGVRKVFSWEDAIKWCNAPISVWCRIETENLLMASVRSNSPNRYQDWNNVAIENQLKVQLILNEFVMKRAPEKYADSIKLYIQSQLVGLLLEVFFGDCSSIDLFQQQFKWYEKGFFPCGWHVDSPEGFPDASKFVVF